MPSTDLSLDLKELIISTLNLEDLGPQDIDPAAALFNTGLGLDSIDALELGVAIQKRYGLRFDASAEDTKQHFASVNALAAYVSAHQSKQGS
jgi:acyl carrier protein